MDFKVRLHWICSGSQQNVVSYQDYITPTKSTLVTKIYTVIMKKREQNF